MNISFCLQVDPDSMGVQLPHYAHYVAYDVLLDSLVHSGAFQDSAFTWDDALSKPPCSASLLTAPCALVPVAQVRTGVVASANMTRQMFFNSVVPIGETPKESMRSAHGCVRALSVRSKRSEVEFVTSLKRVSEQQPATGSAVRSLYDIPTLDTSDSVEAKIKSEMLSVRPMINRDSLLWDAVVRKRRMCVHPTRIHVICCSSRNPLSGLCERDWASLLLCDV